MGRRVAQGFNVVKVSVADVRVEHEVKLGEFTKRLEKAGGSPRDVSQRQRIRSILGIRFPDRSQFFLHQIGAWTALAQLQKIDIEFQRQETQMFRGNVVFSIRRAKLCAKAFPPRFGRKPISRR
jgi:hypothetical protein